MSFNMQAILGWGWKLLEWVCHNVFRCVDKSLLK